MKKEKKNKNRNDNKKLTYSLFFSLNFYTNFPTVIVEFCFKLNYDFKIKSNRLVILQRAGNYYLSLGQFYGPFFLWLVDVSTLLYLMRIPDQKNNYLK